MKIFNSLFVSVVVLLLGFSCDEKTEIIESEFTGNEVVYQLVSTTDYDMSGHIVFKEKKDGSLQVETVLENTQKGGIHPVHLHHGSVSEDGYLVAILNPVSGNTGSGITEITALGSGKSFNYSDLLKYNGSIRIHLDDSYNSNVILSGGNIGTNNQGESNVKSCTDFSF